MMKTKVAMAISLAGVLAAGTAAALVNTHVLNGGTSSPVAIDAPHTPQTTVAQASSPPAGGSVNSASPVNPPSGAASTTQATYAIGASGTVTLDTASDVLTIVAVTPTAGWTVAQSESTDGSNAEVKFHAGSTEVEFHANLLYGVVRTSVETHDLSATGTTGVANVNGDDNSQGGSAGTIPVPQGSSDTGSGGDD